ncbi:MAG: hypothetical protein O2820_16165 [Planctomycetota bacterium]|nr:hypothetical protein [Planctomycetota bacterium]MDA1250754.1 hypothetical protein [Planctomycetota bacterium]
MPRPRELRQARTQQPAGIHATLRRTGKRQAGCDPRAGPGNGLFLERIPGH